jgi:hypothetical protein
LLNKEKKQILADLQAKIKEKDQLKEKYEGLNKKYQDFYDFSKNGEQLLTT